MKPLADYARTRHSPFDLGYLVHLLTDPFWCASYRDIPGLLGADGHTHSEIYYREMNRCESALIDEELFALVRQAVPPADHPLLKEDEMAEWRSRVLMHP